MGKYTIMKKKQDKMTAFDKFVSDMDAKFKSLEKLLDTKPPKAGEKTGQDEFKLLQENYDQRFSDFSTELTSLKELVTGVTDRVNKAKDDNGFLSALLGF